MKSLVLRLILNAGIVFKYRMSTHGKRQSDISLAMVEQKVPRQSVMSMETGIAGKRNVEVGRHLSFDLDVAGSNQGTGSSGWEILRIFNDGEPIMALSSPVDGNGGGIYGIGVVVYHWTCMD